MQNEKLSGYLKRNLICKEQKNVIHKFLYSNVLTLKVSKIILVISPRKWLFVHRPKAYCEEDSNLTRFQCVYWYQHFSIIAVHSFRLNLQQQPSADRGVSK